MKTRFSHTCLWSVLLCVTLLPPRAPGADPLLHIDQQMQSIQWSSSVGGAALTWLTPWEADAYGSLVDSVAGQSHRYQWMAWNVGTPILPQVSAPLGVSFASGQSQIGASGDLSGVSLSGRIDFTPAPGANSYAAGSGGSADRDFQFVGGAGPLSVTFSFDYSGLLKGGAGAKGALLQTLPALRIWDGVNLQEVTAYQELIAPGNLEFTGTASETFTLQFNTPYSLILSLDNEITVPEPGVASLVVLGLSVALFSRCRPRRTQASASRSAAARKVPALLAVAGLGLGLGPQFAHAHIIPPRPPAPCNIKNCNDACNKDDPCCVPAGSSLSLVRGSMEDSYNVLQVGGGRAALSVSLYYSSAQANDEALLAGETPLAFGWTHSYGAFLFRQQGVLFSRGPNGAIVKFNRIPGSSPSLYKAVPGYFDTITANADGSFTLFHKDGSTEQFQLLANSPYFFYGPIYQLTQQTDARGNTNQLAYDSHGRLAAVTDAYGRAITFTYGATLDNTNRLVAITDPLGRSTWLGYTELGAKLVSITDPASNTVAYAYDSSYRVRSKTDKLGHTYLYSYNSGTVSAQLVRDGSPLPLVSLGNTNNWAIDGSALNASLTTRYFPSAVIRTDSRGNLWTNAYDVNGAITTITAPDGSTRSFAYDPVTFQQSALTDAYGRTTYRQYDAWGNLLAETNCLGQVTRYTYETNFNQVTSITDPNGFVTTNRYDAQGNLIQQTDPLGFSQYWTYDAHGNVLTEQDKNGNITRHYYDPFGNRTNTTDALGNVTSFAYDAVGNLISRTDANGHTSAYAYDAMNRLIATTNGLSASGPARALLLAGPPQLSITAQADGTFLLHWTGSGLTLTRTRNLSQPFEDVLAGGLPVTASPFRVSAPLTNVCEFYRLRTSGGAVVPAGGASPRTSPEPLVLQVTLFTYDASGNKTSETDANGNTTSYAYDEKGRLTYTTNALGGETSNIYDLEGNLLSQTDANGHTTWYAYDTQNRLIYTTNALGYVTAQTYDLVGNPITATDANGHTTWSTYDCLNRLIATTNALGYVTQYEYDAGPGGGGCGCGAGTKGTGHIIKLTDANGKVTYSKYDPLGRLLKTIRKQGDTADAIGPNDAVTAYTYDSNGNSLTVTDPNNITNFYAYDTLNRQIALTNGVGDVTLHAYDALGNLLTTTAPSGNITTNTYDALNRLVQVDDAIGRVANYSYDPAGNQLSIADGNGNTTSYAYDALKRLVRQTDAMGHSSTNCYDSVGNLIRWVDRNDNATGFAYDALNRKTAETNALGFVTRSTYDGVGNKVAIADANGNTTTFSYDAANRQVQTTYPDTPSDTVLYTYDGVGNLLSRTDQKGNTTVYSYSDLYLLTNRAYASDPADRFTYDLGGRMVSASKTNWLTATDWVVTFVYDGANRVTNTTQGGRVLAYEFNTPARTRRLTYPSGTNITEATDFRNRLLTVSDGALPPIATYTYDLDNRVLTCTHRNGVVADYAYNPNSWITSLIHTNPVAGNLVAGFTYAYDKEGHKLYEENLWNLNRSEAYAYDPIYRLTNWLAGRLVGSTVPVATNRQAWQLDGQGNWLTTITNGVLEYRTHDAANEISTIQTDGGPVAPLYYDPNGNLTNDGRYAYAYDNENRLVKATRLFLIPGDTGPRLVGQYVYDALGRRIARIADAAPAGAPAAVVSLHDGARVIEEQAPAGAQLATYTYGCYLDEVLTMLRAGRSFSLHQNALWSVVAVSDDAANTAERYAYSAYGCVLITDGAGNPIPQNAWDVPHSAIGNPYLFAGRQVEEETGLSGDKGREYELETGRYLQRNLRLSFEGANNYEYSQGNPVNRDRAATADPNRAPQWPGEAGWFSGDWYKTQNTVVCDGNGSLTIHEATAYKYGVQECTKKHEQQHLTDWKARYGENCCKNRALGDLPNYNPPGQPKYADFLKKSECEAWKIGQKCRKEKLENCCKLAPAERKKCQDYIETFVKQAEEEVKQYCN